MPPATTAQPTLKGLGAIGNVAVARTNIFYLPYTALQLPEGFNTRRTFDRRKLKQLATSIREEGVTTPLIGKMTAEGDSFDVYQGERRMRAMALISADEPEHPALQRVPCVKEKKGTTDVDRIFTLITDNLGEPLNMYEQGLTFARLRGEGLSNAAIGRRTGYSHTHINSALALVDHLPEKLLALAADGTASYKVLASLVRHYTSKNVDPALTADYPDLHGFIDAVADCHTPDNPLRPRHVERFLEIFNASKQQEAEQADADGEQDDEPADPRRDGTAEMFPDVKTDDSPPRDRGGRGTFTADLSVVPDETDTPDDDTGGDEEDDDGATGEQPAATTPGRGTGDDTGAKEAKTAFYAKLKKWKAHMGGGEFALATTATVPYEAGGTGEDTGIYIAANCRLSILFDRCGARANQRRNTLRQLMHFFSGELSEEDLLKFIDKGSA